MRMIIYLIESDESDYVSDREWWEWSSSHPSAAEVSKTDRRGVGDQYVCVGGHLRFWLWRWLLRGWRWAETWFRKTTCCHFFRQSAPLGRLKAHPLNSGCHGVPDWSSLIDVIVPWQILKNMFPGLSWSWMFKVDIWNVKHIHILFIRFWVDLISTKKVQDISKAVKLIYFQRIFFFSNFKENSVKDDDAHIFLFVVNLQWWN